MAGTTRNQIETGIESKQQRGYVRSLAYGQIGGGYSVFD
jgi:hypothetical protein